MTPYTEYKHLPPPRPKHAIHPSGLKVFDGRGWIAQPKLNGEYNIVAVTPERNLISSKRDGKKHVRWAFDEASAKAFKAIPGKGWYVFCCELLHNKTPHIKNVNYIHDILAFNSEQLDTTTYPERHALLRGLFPTIGKSDQGYHIINDNLWLADIFLKDFNSLYLKLTYAPECEGLVLKNVSTRLSFEDPSKGMVKCRKPTKNYGF